MIFDIAKENFDPSKLFSNILYSSTMKTDPYAKRVFTGLFTGMQGQYTRLKIITTLDAQPMNVNRLSKGIDYDYKAIQRNVIVLEKNNLIEDAED